MMAFGVLNEGLGSREVFKVILRKQLVGSVIGDELPLGANKQNARAPPLMLLRSQNMIRLAAMIPGQGEGLPMPSGYYPIGKLVADLQPDGCGVFVDRWALGLGGGGMA